MKKLLFSLFILVGLNSYSQDKQAEKIIDDYLNSIGSKEKLENVHSISQKGVMKVKGMEFPYDSYQDSSGKILVRMNLMGTQITALAFDGNKGYTFAQYSYMDIPEDKVAAYKEKAKNIFGYIYKYKEKGTTANYKGEEKIDGVTYNVVHLHLKEPNEGGVQDLDVLFDKNNKLLSFIRIEKDNKILLTKVNEYKEFDGVKFATKTTSKVGDITVMDIVFNEIKINPPAPAPKEFEKPQQ